LSQLLEKVDVSEVPPYIKAWSVTGVDRFIPAILGRWQRERGAWPQECYLVFCPRVEVNALGGLPGEVLELSDPRHRMSHFTGCHRPYTAILLQGEDADQRRAAIHELLPWSESYRATVEGERVRLTFLDATEDLLEDPPDAGQARERFQKLCASGEIATLLG
jgi:hypothetical protein